MHQLLQIEALSKSFGGTNALADVALRVQRGEVHGLVGENGAGKSTLIKVLSGLVRPDSGSFRFNGKSGWFADAQEAISAGVAVVHQEPSVFLHLNAVDNLLLGREPVWNHSPIINRKGSLQKAEQMMAVLGSIKVPLDRPLMHLSVAQRQLVSIAGAVASDCKLLILDEPTASLSVYESELLQEAVQALHEANVSVLFVSHRLEEILSTCSTVSVMRGGRVVSTQPSHSLNTEDLVRLMVGKDLARPTQVDRPMCDRLFSATIPGDPDVRLSARSGEIVGIGGLVGSGRSRLLRRIFGVDQANGATVTVGDKTIVPGNPMSAVRGGVALVPEDRQHQGLVTTNSLAENIADSERARSKWFKKVDTRQEQDQANTWIKNLRIKAPSSKAPVEALSGGNQQKVVFAKWLSSKPRVLLLDEPTRGVDVGAKVEIHELIRSFAEDGGAVVMVSSDLQELLALSDRIVVMRDGGVAGELNISEATEKAVMRLATGAGA